MLDHVGRARARNENENATEQMDEQKRIENVVVDKRIGSRRRAKKTTKLKTEGEDIHENAFAGNGSDGNNTTMETIFSYFMNSFFHSPKIESHERVAAPSNLRYIRIVSDNDMIANEFFTVASARKMRYIILWLLNFACLLNKLFQK